MSLLLSLVVRFSRPTSCTLRPTVFFSSTARLFDNELSNSRALVRAHLKEQGFTNFINTTASDFTMNDLSFLKVSFQPALENDIIPDCVGDHSVVEQYALPEIDLATLLSDQFDVKSLTGISDNNTKAFIENLHEVVKNLGATEGTEDAETDTLVVNLLTRVIDLQYFPLRFRAHPRCRLHILAEPYLSARPEFVIARDRASVIVIEDKHIKNKNLTRPKGYGEAQLAAEILTCGDENQRRFSRITPQPSVIPDQTIFGFLMISRYFTFYKTEIPGAYWKELESSLPKNQSIVIKRWPDDAAPETGLDVATPEGRRKVLMAISKIRESLFQ